MNPPLGFTKCDYLLFSNEIIERVAADVSDLTVGKYYCDSHFKILRCVAIQTL